MQNAQEVYTRLLKTKRQIKELKSELTGYYKENTEYKQLEEKMKTLRDNKKQITTSINHQYPDLVTKLDDLKIDAASDKELLNDIILTTVMKGDDVHIENEYQQAVFPIFSVTLKPE